MKLTQMGTGKVLSVNSPILFFAREREIVDEAWPGDIIGVPNHGVLRVGDTLTEGETIKIVGIPNFAPEILRRVRLEDPMKSKQLKRALEDLAEEGVTQVFRRVIGGDHIVGVVGELQLDVLKTRVEAECQVKIDLEPAPFETARWISAGPQAALDGLRQRTTSIAAACPRTATARRCFWRATPGNWATLLEVAGDQILRHPRAFIAGSAPLRGADALPFMLFHAPLPLGGLLRNSLIMIF